MRSIRRVPVAIVVLWLGGAVAGGAAAATLDAVRAAGVVQCGATERMGVAEVEADGRIDGLAVDLCRALTIAVLGPEGRTDFRIYGTDRDYAGAGAGEDQVSFLTADAVVARGLAGALVPGPAIFVAELTLLARPDAPDTLDGTTVCFIAGTPAHQALEAWAQRTGRSLVRIGFQEEVEMQDAFDARHCGAITGDASELRSFQAERASRRDARLLPPLALLPVFAAAPARDGAWAALVDWTLAAVVQSAATPGPWAGSLPGVSLDGLRPDWQAAVMASLGDYRTMVGRHLGAKAWPNSVWPSGLLMPAGVR